MCSLGEEIDPVSEALYGEDFSSVSGQQHALFEEIYWINSGKGIHKKTRGSTCWCCKELQQQLHEANEYVWISMGNNTKQSKGLSIYYVMWDRGGGVIPIWYNIT